MKNVLLVFDDPKELDFIEACLSENGFQIFKSDDLKKALLLAEEKLPDLIVLNTLDTEFDIKMFSQHMTTERLKKITLLSLIELEDYFKTSCKEHFVVKPVRPKLLLSLIRSVMSHEEINWLPSFR